MGEGERYHEFEPPEALRPWVRKLWTYAAPDPSPTLQRIAPDGCPELIFDLGAPYEEQDASGGFFLQPPAILAGQMTRPIAIRPVGPVELVAARFHPDGARDWLGAPLAIVTDARLDVVERMRGFAPPEGDPEGQADALAAWLDAARVRGGWTVDPVVRAEVDALEADAETPAHDPASRRALQRKFLDRVGVSPRTLKAVFRFRRVFDRALADDAPGWLEAGLDAGFFDQPAMAREFRRFLGCTATEWAREQVELARAIASQTYKPGPPHLG